MVVYLWIFFISLFSTYVKNYWLDHHIYYMAKPFKSEPVISGFNAGFYRIKNVSPVKVLV